MNLGLKKLLLTPYNTVCCILPYSTAKTSHHYKVISYLQAHGKLWSMYICNSNPGTRSCVKSQLDAVTLS